MIIPLSLSTLAPGPQHGAARQGLTLCVPYQGPERGPLPVPGPPNDVFQDAHSKKGRMPMSLPSGPGHWPCHVLSHQWGPVAARRGERDCPSLASWCGKGCSRGSLHTQVWAAEGCDCRWALGDPQLGSTCSIGEEGELDRRFCRSFPGHSGALFFFFFFLFLTSPMPHPALKRQPGNLTPSNQCLNLMVSY